jgi:hypothetical protein
VTWPCVIFARLKMKYPDLHEMAGEKLGLYINDQILFIRLREDNSQLRDLPPIVGDSPEVWSAAGEATVELPWVNGASRDATGVMPTDLETSQYVFCPQLRHPGREMDVLTLLHVRPLQNIPTRQLRRTKRTLLFDFAMIEHSEFPSHTSCQQCSG